MIFIQILIIGYHFTGIILTRQQNIHIRFALIVKIVLEKATLQK